jgi:hypothetical protein
MGGFHSN